MKDRDRLISVKQFLSKIATLSNVGLDSNELCHFITDGIYKSCQNNRRKFSVNNIGAIPNHENCTSKNFAAIAEANFARYEQLLLDGRGEAEYNEFLERWQDAQFLAINHEKSEFNTRINTNWQRCQNGKQLWEAIDWKGKSIVYQSTDISPTVMNPYFKKFFQSTKTNDAPVIESMVNQLQHHDLHIPVLDDEPSINEVNAAIKHMGTGTSLDGLSPDILKILPSSMINLILYFMKSCFATKYPENWKSQLLLPHPKKEHTSTKPKLRGIAIAPLLSRIYDSVLNTRVCKWYIPNKEQVGFRKGQGCLLQIFTLYLLMELAKSLKKELFVAFLDYEKAFDFLNRAKLVEKTIEKGVGNTYIHALYDRYSHTTYTEAITY